MREYAVVFEKSRTGWSAFCPDLPGLAVSGATFEEVQELICEGLDFHLEAMLEDRDPIPEPSTRTRMISVEVPNEAGLRRVLGSRKA